MPEATTTQETVEQRRRHQIMKAAEQLFTNCRIHEVTLDEIARAAHVGKGTIYRYFEDKDDLFFQTATSGFDELCDLLNHNVPDDASFHSRLLTACQQIVAFFNQRRRLIRMIQTEESHALQSPGNLRERWIARRRKLVDTLADILAKGAANGEIRSDIPMEVLAIYLLGILRTRGNDLEGTPEQWRDLTLALDIFLSGTRNNSNAMST